MINTKRTMLNVMKRGFSLIELMVVLVAIAALSASLMPRFIDMNKKGEARDEFAKVSELYSRITTLYESDLDFDGVADAWIDQLPRSFKQSGGKVYSVWKNEVIVSEEGTNGFKIEYKNVPAGAACTEFAKQGRTAGWDHLDIDGTTINKESATTDLASVCKAGSGTDTISSFKFIHKT